MPRGRPRKKRDVLVKSAELTVTPLFVQELLVLFAAGLLSSMIVVPVNAMLK